MYSEFEGQQEGERILYVAKPHQLAKRIAIAKILILAILFASITIVISPYIGAIAALVALLLAAGGIWWNIKVYNVSKTYITDRRIFRNELVSPFFQAKRALFWTEVLKAKGYAPNILWRFFNIGTLEVQPKMDEHESVKVKDVYYFEDLANYIDKILYLVKNNPEGISTLSAFIPKPAGQRT